MSSPNEPTAAVPGVGAVGGVEPTVGLGRTVDLGRTQVFGAGPEATVAGPASARTVGASTEPAVTVAPGGETRFGPGVPVGPPVAPAWPQPGAGSGVRSRPVWRRLVSVLSTLLTVVLLVVVGLFLWQRLSPLEIEGVTVAVVEPAGSRCDVTVDVVATVRTNGNAGTIRYQWLRSGSPPGAMVSERVGRGQRSVGLPLRWSFTGVGSARETATVNIVEPSVTQAGTEVRYACRGR
ncbi:hypothetical protein [Micromonospora carbonacea]|uniref:Uncharacterized protein n=1 Tax=Micromonospora carbonacea TaxID=47853 RepID=A0A1C4ZX40_9ACTN|nr:hypothetical protein [Micromonospora carbonacea]SCF37456.1 hypothetical protein GA0070563_110103 [Micromonospora carbonacea]